MPLDGSELAEHALRPVGELVRGCDVREVVFLRVVEPFRIAFQEFGIAEDQIKAIEAMRTQDAVKYLNDVVSRVRYAVKIEAVGGSPAEVIVDYAARNGVDLIVMTTHGRSGISLWTWGSVTDKVLHASCVPVLMLRVPGCLPARTTVRYRAPPLPDLL